MTLSNEPRARAAEVPASPPASRHRSVPWKDGRLVIGVAIVAASALAGAALLGGGEASTGVWAARETLAAGHHLSGADLVRRQVTFSDPAQAETYLFADAALPEPAVLARDVGAGELLPRAALDSGTAPAEVEVPLRVPAESVPATVRRGSVVDVWVTPDPALAGPEAAAADAVLVFADVTVLAVSRPGGALGPSATRQVIVGVGPGEERSLPSALARLAEGSAVLVRNP